MKKRFTEEQIIGFLGEAEACLSHPDDSRIHSVNTLFLQLRSLLFLPSLAGFLCVRLLKDIWITA